MKLNLLKNFLKKMDDEEKYVMLKAFYSAHSIVSPLLVSGIMACVLYSAITGISQIFSIVLMTILLILIKWTYINSVKKIFKKAWQIFSPSFFTYIFVLFNDEYISTNAFLLIFPTCVFGNSSTSINFFGIL